MSSLYSASVFQPDMCIDSVTDNTGGVNICLSTIGELDPWLKFTIPDTSDRYYCCSFEVYLTAPP